MSHREAGQAGIVLLIAAFIILAVAGLAIDGGALVMGKIGLQADADAAARTGAGALNQGVFLTGNGVALDPAAAEAAARTALQTSCPGCTVAVSATPTAITVTLHRLQRTFLLQAVGIPSVAVAATASSSPGPS
jgi:hypothetical protein